LKNFAVFSTFNVTNVLFVDFNPLPQPRATKLGAMLILIENEDFMSPNF